MLVLHIRDLLLRFIGIVVDLRFFIRLIRLFHVALYMLFVFLFVLILFVGFLPLLIVVLLAAVLGRMLLFVFLIVHTAHFKPLRIVLSTIATKKSCHPLITFPPHEG